MKMISLLLLLTISNLSYIYASPPTLHDITQNPVQLYPGASITIDSIRPEHLHMITVGTIKNEVGDFSGDGINDIIIKRSKGFWLLYGHPDGFSDYPEEQLNLSLNDGVELNFSQADQYSLIDVGFIGDVNHDGLADLLAVLASPISGKSRKACIIYGYDVKEFGVKRFSTDFNESQVTTVRFADNLLSWDDYSNKPLSFGGLGDINGDGVDDFFISSFQLNVFFGSKALPVNKPDSIGYEDLMTSFSITSESTPSDSLPTAKVCFGYWAKITKAGDFNSDGFADFLLSTKCPNAQHATSDNKVYIIYGQETFPDTFPLKFLNNPGYPNALIIEPQTNQDFFGSAIAPIGDFNGDSIPDIMISSMFFGKDQTDNLLGGTYIFFGKKSFTGTLSSGYLDLHNDVGRFIPGIGYNIAGIGDLNQDGLADIFLARNSFASVIYGSLNLTRNFPLTSLDGSNGFNLTPISQELIESTQVKTRIQDVISLDDTNGAFAFTYGDGKYHIITKDLPKATACIDAQYCLKSEASMYLDSMFCNSDITTPNEEEESNTNTTMMAYNSLTHGIYDKSKESIVRKDAMSPSTAALLGTAIGVGTCVAGFLLFTFTKKWYTESHYVQLDEQVPDWSEDSRKVKIFKIEEAIKKRFKCYQCLLWGLLVIEILSLFSLFADMNGFDGHFVVGFLLHGFKILAFARAIEAFKKEALEKQKRAVFGMKVLLILAGVFLIIHAISLYQEMKYYWNLPETGIQFALSILLIGFFTIGSQVLVYLYAKKFLKLLEKREELRSHLQNSQADLGSREQDISNA